MRRLILRGIWDGVAANGANPNARVTSFNGIELNGSFDLYGLARVIAKISDGLDTATYAEEWSKEIAKPPLLAVLRREPIGRSARQ